jgi:hypothetical protein
MMAAVLDNAQPVTSALCVKYALRLIHFQATLYYRVCNMCKDSAQRVLENKF